MSVLCLLVGLVIWAFAARGALVVWRKWRPRVPQYSARPSEPTYIRHKRPVQQEPNLWSRERPYYPLPSEQPGVVYMTSEASPVVPDEESSPDHVTSKAPVYGRTLFTEVAEENGVITAMAKSGEVIGIIETTRDLLVDPLETPKRLVNREKDGLKLEVVRLKGSPARFLVGLTDGRALCMSPSRLERNEPSFPTSRAA